MMPYLFIIYYCQELIVNLITIFIYKAYINNIKVKRYNATKYTNGHIPNTHTTVPLARINIGSIRVDREIGTDRWSVSTRPTRIRTDFWNDLVDLC